MAPSHDPPLILVADDQMPTAVMLERVFEYEGYQVKSVYDGIAAINAAETLLPDLILLDINMPGLNGFEVLTRLRANPATSHIPTILITAMGDFSNVVQGLNLGADDYLRKPFHPQELLARAQSKMKARLLEDALHKRTQELEALLRVTEELNQHIELDELLDFVLFLAADLLQNTHTFIGYLPENTQHLELRVLTKPATIRRQAVMQDETLYHIIAKLAQTNLAQVDIKPFSEIAPCPWNVVIPLTFGDEVRGLVGICNNSKYGESDVRLFTGLTRQISLALQNAELYVMKANYAKNLEEQVLERTVELRSAQQMLVRSEKLASIGRLSAAVAHEINNPLLPIRLDLEGMMEDIDQNRQIDRQDIAHTLENVERIEYTVRRLLGFTGSKRDEDEVLNLLNVNDIIQDIIKLNNRFFQQADIKIIKDLGDIPAIQANRYQLEYVFMNLMLNAKDAIGRNGSVVFRTYSDGGMVVAEVADDGCGIASDMIDEIYEPFVSTKEDGNGLGLYISHQIVTNHNGEISAVSAPNAGTTFTIRFPVSS